MSWARLDDNYDDHPKVRQAWREHPAAVGVHVMAITHSARYGTDGLVHGGWLRELMPHWAQRRKVLAVLVSNGLFDLDADGTYHVHDFLDYNPSRLSKAETSAASREAARVRWAKERARRNAERSASPTAESNADAMRTPMLSRPDPTRPVLTTGGSPVVCGRASATSGAPSLEPNGDPKAALAVHVAGILQRGIDSLTTTEGCRPPTANAVLAVLGDAEPGVAEAVAWEVRSIAQSQNRAPNIVGLFASRLTKGIVEGASS